MDTGDASRRKLSLLTLIILGVVSLIILWGGVGYINQIYGRWDKNEDRGAAIVEADPFDAPVNDTTYLPQGWDAADSLWFYNATQGSNILPYDFFLVLERAEDEKDFKENQNINKYRYLPQKETFSNPDALPVGMTKDTYQGKEYMGFTCAACHTSQINYKGLGIRIDGGPTAADMESFLVDLAASLEKTLEDPAKRNRFYSKVLAKGNYDNESEIEDDLKKYAVQLRTYTEVNKPEACVKTEDDQNPGKCIEYSAVHYGYARLDAFGRIYNRVLQHVISSKKLGEILQKKLPPDVWAAASDDINTVLGDEGDQSHLIMRAMQALVPYLPKGVQNKAAMLADIRREIYNPANSPVSYPFLWDIPQHDYVQWTGLVTNSGLGPLGRNVGQVIGVFATLDWQVKPGWTIYSVLGGQGFGATHVDFKSSIDKRNLRRVENQLRTLQSPEWPNKHFSATDQINKELASRGRPIFKAYCESCHENIVRHDPDRRIIASMSHVDSIGTDRVLADNTVKFEGFSGILRNYYVDVGSGKLVLQPTSKVAPLVSLASKNVVVSWDPDKNMIRRIAEWLYDTVKTLLENDVKTSLKQGNYEPATTNKPFAPLFAYKARSLNGIWATAPYLHNGSVPTLYDLLLPKREGTSQEYQDKYRSQCSESIEYRPDEFFVGSREFDPKKVGFRYTGYKGFKFQTGIPGNSNSGHEYAAGRTPQQDGKILTVLCRSDRMALLEYLKTL